MSMELLWKRGLLLGCSSSGAMYPGVPTLIGMHVADLSVRTAMPKSQILGTRVAPEPETCRHLRRSGMSGLQCQEKP